MEIIKYFEGCRLEAYQDSASVYTIGYGHTKGVKAGMKITKEQANEFLKQDLKQAEERVRKALPNMVFTEYELQALISLAFNLRSFEKLASHLKVSKEKFKDKMLLYCKDIKGNYLSGLKRRRMAERLLFEGKDWRGIADRLDGQHLATILEVEKELFDV